MACVIGHATRLFCPLSVESAALRNGHRREKYNYRMTYAMGGMREAGFPSTMVPATSPSGAMSRPAVR